MRRTSRWKRLLSLAVVPLPSWIKSAIYRTVFGYAIGRDVRIGWSWICVDRLSLGDHGRIGHLNQFLDIPDVRVGPSCTIGHRNRFHSSAEFTHDGSLRDRGNRPVLTLGSHCSITSGHHFDINDELSIGAFTVVAGVDSLLFTHYLDVRTGDQSAKPIRIGSYCMLGAAVRLAPGAVIPDYCVVGMGSVVTKAFDTPYTLLAGSPAREVQPLPRDGKYFTRRRGWIGTYTRPPSPDEGV